MKVLLIMVIMLYKSVCALLNQNSGNCLASSSFSGIGFVFELEIELETFQAWGHQGQGPRGLISEPSCLAENVLFALWHVL